MLTIAIVSLIVSVASGAAAILLNGQANQLMFEAEYSLAADYYNYALLAALLALFAFAIFLFSVRDLWVRRPSNRKRLIQKGLALEKEREREQNGGLN